MKIAVGCDHGGFPLKDAVIEAVKAAGHEVIDVGTFSADAVDFPDFTKKVGEAIQKNEAHSDPSMLLGIVVVILRLPQSLGYL